MKRVTAAGGASFIAAYALIDGGVCYDCGGIQP